MNCIFLPQLIRELRDFPIPLDEVKHIKALRINNDEIILATNGKGLSSNGKVIFIKKNQALFYPDNFYENLAENTFRSALAIGILDNKDRFEFALEKAIELGINEFYPLITENTQKRKINTDRLSIKAISAMKQCCRSILPEIYNPLTIEQLLNNSIEYERIILADINGVKTDNLKSNLSTLVIIGPEGGFSSDEIKLMKRDKRLILINLGLRRLRAETAAIVTLGLLV